MPTCVPPALTALRLHVAGLLLAAVAAAQGAMAQDRAAAPETLSEFPYFKLRTSGSEGQERCLEANSLGASSALGGASFLDRCRAATGQGWLAVPTGDGRFRLQSWLHAARRCLAINAGEIDAVAPMAPYMAPCVRGGAVFSAAPSDDRNGFALVTADAGRQACLDARPSGDEATRGAVSAAACDGTDSQTWIVLGGRLSGGVPVADRPASPPDRSGAFAGPVMDSECSWNDGQSDRPEYFACHLDRVPEGGFTVLGPGRTHAFAADPERPGAARGTLSVGAVTVQTGLFESTVEDVTCWLNARTQERLCIW